MRSVLPSDICDALAPYKAMLSEDENKALVELCSQTEWNSATSGCLDRLKSVKLYGSVGRSVKNLIAVAEKLHQSSSL